MFQLPRLATHLLAATFLLAAAACGGEREGYYEVGDPEARPALATEPPEVARFFPPSGYRGLVLNRCSSCHSVACTLVGDRDVERWRQVEVSHLHYNPGLSIEDRGKIFDYLIEHFGAEDPKPDVPASFLEGGCPVLTDEKIATLPEWDPRLE